MNELPPGMRTYDVRARGEEGDKFRAFSAMTHHHYLLIPDLINGMMRENIY